MQSLTTLVLACATAATGIILIGEPASAVACASINQFSWDCSGVFSDPPGRPGITCLTEWIENGENAHGETPYTGNGIDQILKEDCWINQNTNPG